MSTSSAAESLASSADCPETPEVLDITLILPDGQEEELSVQSNKQMMDLLIQLAATHKLSPAGYLLQAYDPDTGRPIQYKASQTLGSLGVNILHLASKRQMSNSEPKPFVPSQRPFDMTHRVTVNLPRNQKHVLRVKPSLTLAQIFQQTCDEKNLDPYKYELQHPTDSRVALNMADPLLAYTPLAELTLVSISEVNTLPRPPPSTRPALSDPALRTTSTMPKSKKKAEPSDEPYMPGMKEKKKKGIFALFSRKKGAKFEVSAESSNRHSMAVSSAPPPQREPPRVRPQSEVIASVAVPLKPPRKKRPAPLPPPLQKPAPVHSRSSSHSSGFGEGSPGTAVRPEVTQPQDALSVDSGETTIQRTTRKKRAAPAPPPPAPVVALAPIEVEVTPEPVMETPPSPASLHEEEFHNGAQEEEEEEEEEEEGDSALEVTAISKTSSSEEPEFVAHLSPAVIEELKQEPYESTPPDRRPLCQFVAPPPPLYTPPPLELAPRLWGKGAVSDIATQVHVTPRDTLSSDAGLQATSSTEDILEDDVMLPSPPSQIQDDLVQRISPQLPETPESMENDPFPVETQPTPGLILREETLEVEAVEPVDDDDVASSVPASRRSSSSSVPSSIMNAIDDSDTESEEDEALPQADNSVVLLKLNSTEEEPKKRVLAAPVDLVIDKDEFLEDDEEEEEVEAVLYNQVKVVPRIPEDEELAVIEEHEFEDQIADEITLDDDVDYVEPVKIDETKKGDVDIDDFQVKDYPSIKRKDNAVEKNLVITESQLPPELSVPVDMDEVVVPVEAVKVAEPVPVEAVKVAEPVPVEAVKIAEPVLSLREAMRQPPKPVPMFQKDPTRKSGDFGNSMFLSSHEAGSSPKPEPKTSSNEVRVSSPSFVVKQIIRPVERAPSPVVSGNSEVVHRTLISSTSEAPEPSPPPVMRSTSQLDRPTVTDEDRKRISFWGPRPWNARHSTENNIRNVSSSLQNLRQATERPSSAMVIREGSPDRLDGNDKRMITAPIKATEAVKQEDVVHYNSTGDIQAPKEEETTDTAAKKKTLQAQYADLQQQFTKWQQQIVDNQELLARKRIIAEEGDENEAVISEAPSIPESPEPNHRHLVKADSDVIVRQESPHVYNTRPSSVSDLPANVGLASRFSGEDLAVGRSNLRQNSQEEKRPQSIHYGADGRKQSLSKKGGFSIGSAYHGVALSVPQQQLKPPSAPAPPPTTAPKRIIRPSVESLLDPREELMISIRNTGGMAALRKIQVDETNW